MVICREQQCRRATATVPTAGIFAVMAMQPEHENTAMWDMKVVDLTYLDVLIGISQWYGLSF
ncbi:hypothetical protein MCOR07_010847 [Pyricularia oryzae]|nr:hypothetical protein MCOR34_011823 [Pyricularia oryzae]KAI6610495.1 hypothetical protein MCOR07_010847 [Pyricularia oryzae]